MDVVSAALGTAPTNCCGEYSWEWPTIFDLAYQGLTASLVDPIARNAFGYYELGEFSPVGFVDLVIKHSLSSTLSDFSSS